MQIIACYRDSWLPFSRRKNTKLFGRDYEYNYVFHRNLAFRFTALGPLALDAFSPGGEQPNKWL